MALLETSDGEEEGKQSEARLGERERKMERLRQRGGKQAAEKGRARPYSERRARRRLTFSLFLLPSSLPSLLPGIFSTSDPMVPEAEGATLSRGEARSMGEGLGVGGC